MKRERGNIGKSLLYAVLMTGMVALGLSYQVLSMAKTEESYRYSGPIFYDPDQMEDYSLSDIKQMNESDEEFDFMMSEEGYLEELYGTYSNITVDSWETAIYSLYNIKTLLGMDHPFEELELEECYHDDFGFSYNFRQVNKGKPVSDRGLVISCDGQGKITMLSSSYLPMETIHSIEQRELRGKSLRILVNIFLLIAVAIWIFVMVRTSWNLFHREERNKEMETDKGEVK